ADLTPSLTPSPLRPPKQRLREATEPRVRPPTGARPTCPRPWTGVAVAVGMSVVSARVRSHLLTATRPAPYGTGSSARRGLQTCAPSLGIVVHDADTHLPSSPRPRSACWSDGAKFSLPPDSDGPGPCAGGSGADAGRARTAEQLSTCPRRIRSRRAEPDAGQAERCLRSARARARALPAPCAIGRYDERPASDKGATQSR